VKIKTNVKAGRIILNHNQTVIRVLKVKTDVKSDAVKNDDGSGPSLRRRQIITRGLKVKTGVKAGPPDPPIIRG
jgi:hypothetical protein